MSEKYIGLENEFITWQGDNEVSFRNYLDDFRNSLETFDENNHNFIKSMDGNVFYRDGDEIEINTPPIIMDKGFSSRVIDSLLLARDDLAYFGERRGLRFTEYSMHWNTTKDSSVEDNSFYEGIAVPFRLFGTNPLSKAFNLRAKPGRMELLGDSLASEDQLKATALLLGAYSYAIKDGKPFHILNNRNLDFNDLQYHQGLNFRTGSKVTDFLPDGRYSELLVSTVSEPQEMQAQQFLEMYYDWLKPYVEELGNKDEIKNLEDFIYMRKPLESDKFNLYAYMLNQDVEEDGKFRPRKFDENNATFITKSNKERELPLENRLMRAIYENPRERYDPYAEWGSWDSLPMLTDRRGDNPDETGLERFYTEGMNRDPSLKKPRHPDLSHVQTNEIGDFVLPEKVFYDPKNDHDFIKQKDKKTMMIDSVVDELKDYGRNIRDDMRSAFTTNRGNFIFSSLTFLAIYGALNLLGSLVAGEFIASNYRERNENLEVQTENVRIIDQQELQELRGEQDEEQDIE